MSCQKNSFWEFSTRLRVFFLLGMSNHGKNHKQPIDENIYLHVNGSRTWEHIWLEPVCEFYANTWMFTRLRLALSSTNSTDTHSFLVPPEGWGFRCHEGFVCQSRLAIGERYWGQFCFESKFIQFQFYEFIAPDKIGRKLWVYRLSWCQSGTRDSRLRVIRLQWVLFGDFCCAARSFRQRREEKHVAVDEPFMATNWEIHTFKIHLSFSSFRIKF